MRELLHVVFRSVAFAAALLAASSAANAQTSAPTTIRFISSGSDDLLPFWYAQSKDMFRAAGLNVIWTNSASGALSTQGVLAGAADVGRASLSSLIAAHVRGIPFVLVAPSAIHRHATSINSGILVATNSPLRKPGDLQGKTLSCTAIGDIGYLGLRAMIDAQGGDSSTIKWVEIPISAAAAAVDQGRVDASISAEPFLSRDLAGGKVRVLVDMLDGYPGEILEGAFFSTRDFAAANTDALARFAAVLRQAAIYANAHGNELIPLLVSNTGMEPEVAARMHRAENGVNFAPSQVQPVIDIAAKYKILPRAFDAREMFLSPAATTKSK
jgi:NitT/TauT family transport system substrate-binding protein